MPLQDDARARYREDRELNDIESAVIEARLRQVLDAEAARINPVVRMSRMTPKLNGLQQKFAEFTARIEGAVDKIYDEMDQTAAYTESGIVKYSGAVRTIKETAKAIDDAANQMTNGGPPLADSGGQA